MNCRSEVLEVSVEGRQVEEAMLAVLHTVLLHRSTGKFHYKKEGTYSIGTVGTQDVDCDFIDFTYVRVSSEELDRALRKVVGEFRIYETGTLSPRACPRPHSLNQDLLCWPLLNSSDCGLQGGRVAQGTEMKKQLQRCPRSHGDQSRGRPQQRIPHDRGPRVGSWPEARSPLRARTPFYPIPPCCT
ncbi:autophagy-related protein 101 isoform X2 [Tursiops truncatus]|uniref:autophagy-related protein 101 isoform X2 n=1 Tax=Tursiops truncatus TaxID=9739 RepID=UPI003CCF7467